MKSSQAKLAEQVLQVELCNPGALTIITGDFNKANLHGELPKYRQLVTCATREQRILDHCYSTIKDAYHSARTTGKL